MIAMHEVPFYCDAATGGRTARRVYFKGDEMVKDEPTDEPVFLF